MACLGPKPIPGIYKAYIFIVSKVPIKKSMVAGTADVVLELPTSTALELKIGQFVNFRGRIESIDSRGGTCCLITLSNGSVLRSQ